MKNSTHVVVRGDDIDVNGHVRDAKYLDYAAHARWMTLERAGLSMAKLAELKLGPVTLEHSVKYLRELRLGDEVDIEIRMTNTSPRTLLVEHTITRTADGVVAARVSSVTGLLDLRERKLVDDVVAGWTQLLGDAEVVGLLDE